MADTESISVGGLNALALGEKRVFARSIHARRNKDGTTTVYLRRKVAGKSVDVKVSVIEAVSKATVNAAIREAERLREEKLAPKVAEPEGEGEVVALNKASTLAQVWAHQLADIDASGTFWSERNRDANVARIKTHCAKWAIWHKPIASLTTDDLTTPLMKLRGDTPHQMRKLVGLLNGMYDHADVWGLKVESPMPLVVRRLSHNHKAAKVEHFPAITDVEQLRKLYARIVNLTGEASVRNALRLQAFCCMRTGEVIGAQWSEFHDLDGSTPRWVIPRERMKIDDPSRKDHVLYLSRQCAKWLRELRASVDAKATFLFPGRMGADHVTSESCSKSMRDTLNMRGVMVPHGWRSSIATLARRAVNEQGTPLFSESWIEGLLDHLSGDQVKDSYNRGEHHEPVGRVLQWWSDQIAGE